MGPGPTRLPETMTCPETGEIMHRDTRPFVVRYKDEAMTVSLPGFYPAGDGDGVHVGDDMKPVDEALRALKEKVDGIPTPTTIRSLRQKLGLSQRDAGALLKVGENAFDKYERGLTEPSGPTAQLLHLLDRHPELIDELRAMVR